jgi:hypothetical protein
VGASSNPKVKPVGVESISKSVEQLKNEIHRRITPPVSVDIDVMSTESERVIRVQVPLGEDPPYAIDDNKIYVREETETSLAVRDEIVQLVRRSESMRGVPQRAEAPQEKEPAEPRPSRPSPKPRHEPSDKIEAPRTGVEIVATEKRNDTYYHHLRDLRNGNIVRNVTRKSARKLWHYAITQVEDGKVQLDRLAWQEGIAEIQSYKRAGKMRYDLAQRENGKTRMYFGVTEDGIQDGQHKAWRELLSLEEED